MAVLANNSDALWENKTMVWLSMMGGKKEGRRRHSLVREVRRELCEDMTFWSHQITPKPRVATFLAEKTGFKSPKGHKWGQRGWRTWERGAQSEMILKRSYVSMVFWCVECIKHQENMPRPREHSFTPFWLLESVQINLLGTKVRNEVKFNWEQRTYTLVSKCKR